MHICQPFCAPFRDRIPVIYTFIATHKLNSGVIIDRSDLVCIKCLTYDIGCIIGSFMITPAKRKALLASGTLMNENHNHDLKNIFKGAATKASSCAGPFHDFYEALLAKGRKPSMARLTLARKIAAITLIVWKKGVSFDAKHLKQHAV
jgi:hypothetical protein